MNTLYMTSKKDARFSNGENIPELLSDDRESKKIGTYFSNRAGVFYGNPVAFLIDYWNNEWKEWNTQYDCVSSNHPDFSFMH